MIIQIVRKSNSIQIQIEMHPIVHDWIWLIIVGGYFLISTFFLCFPNILHKRKRFGNSAFNEIIQGDRIFCVGHRGAGYEAPENTLEGFAHAIKACDILEMDVCGTKDGKIVINHDVNFLRTTGVDKDINQLNYDQLPTLKEQYIPYCAHFNLKTTRNKIPLLEDLFKKYPKTMMSVQMKTPLLKPTGDHTTEDWPIKQVNRLIKKYQREDITIWGCELEEYNKKMYEENSNILNFYSEPEVYKMIVLFLLGLLPFVCLREGCAFLPLVCNVLRQELLMQKSSDCMRSFKIGFYRFFNFILRFFITHIQKRGVICMLFTVDQKQEFELAASIGPKGIVSDRPTDLAKFLKERCLNFNHENQQSQNHLIK